MIDERVLPAFSIVREPVMQAGDDVAGLVAGFVRGMGQMVAEHPWLPALWVREVLCEGGALREVLFDRIGAAAAADAGRAIRAGPGAGQLNLDLDPRLLMVSLVGLTLFPAAARRSGDASSGRATWISMRCAATRWRC